MSPDTRSDAYRQAYRDNYNAVYRYMSRRLGPDLAHDATAETFLTAWNKWDSRPDEDPYVVTCWIFAIARNKSLHALRQRQRDSALVHMDSFSSESVSPDPSAESCATAMMAVVAGFGSLSETDREVLAAAAREDATMVSIGARLGISPSAAANRLMLARRRFRALLN